MFNKLQKCTCTSDIFGKITNYDVIVAILEILRKRKYRKITPDTHMNLHIIFRQDRTIFEEVRNLA